MINSADCWIAAVGSRHGQGAASRFPLARRLQSNCSRARSAAMENRAPTAFAMRGYAAGQSFAAGITGIHDIRQLDP